MAEPLGWNVPPSDWNVGSGSRSSGSADRAEPGQEHTLSSERHHGRRRLCGRAPYSGTGGDDAAEAPNSRWQAS
jgi:hypothetical protein